MQKRLLARAAQHCWKKDADRNGVRGPGVPETMTTARSQATNTAEPQACLSRPRHPGAEDSRVQGPRPQVGLGEGIPGRRPCLWLLVQGTLEARGPR